MSEFCVKCSEKEATIEYLQKQLYEIEQLAADLQSRNEALVLDVAFYEKRIDVQD